MQTSNTIDVEEATVAAAAQPMVMSTGVANGTGKPAYIRTHSVSSQAMPIIDTPTPIVSLAWHLLHAVATPMTILSATAPFRIIDAMISPTYPPPVIPPIIITSAMVYNLAHKIMEGVFAVVSRQPLAASMLPPLCTMDSGDYATVGSVLSAACVGLARRKMTNDMVGYAPPPSLSKLESFVSGVLSTGHPQSNIIQTLSTDASIPIPVMKGATVIVDQRVSPQQQPPMLNTCYIQDDSDIFGPPMVDQWVQMSLPVIALREREMRHAPLVTPSDYSCELEALRILLYLVSTGASTFGTVVWDTIERTINQTMGTLPIPYFAPNTATKIPIWGPVHQSNTAAARFIRATLALMKPKLATFISMLWDGATMVDEHNDPIRFCNGFCSVAPAIHQLCRDNITHVSSIATPMVAKLGDLFAPLARQQKVITDALLDGHLRLFTPIATPLVERICRPGCKIVPFERDGASIVDLADQVCVPPIHGLLKQLGVATYPSFQWTEATTFMSLGTINATDIIQQHLPSLFPPCIAGNLKDGIPARYDDISNLIAPDDSSKEPIEKLASNVVAEMCNHEYRNFWLATKFPSHICSLQINNTHNLVLPVLEPKLSAKMPSKTIEAIQLSAVVIRSAHTLAMIHANMQMFPLVLVWNQLFGLVQHTPHGDDIIVPVVPTSSTKPMSIVLTLRNPLSSYINVIEENARHLRGHTLFETFERMLYHQNHLPTRLTHAVLHYIERTWIADFDGVMAKNKHNQEPMRSIIESLKIAMAKTYESAHESISMGSAGSSPFARNTISQAFTIAFPNKHIPTLEVTTLVSTTASVQGLDTPFTQPAIKYSAIVANNLPPNRVFHVISETPQAAKPKSPKSETKSTTVVAPKAQIARPILPDADVESLERVPMVVKKTTKSTTTTTTLPPTTTDPGALFTVTEEEMQSLQEQMESVKKSNVAPASPVSVDEDGDVPMVTKQVPIKPSGTQFKSLLTGKPILDHRAGQFQLGATFSALDLPNVRRLYPTGTRVAVDMEPRKKKLPPSIIGIGPDLSLVDVTKASTGFWLTKEKVVTEFFVSDPSDALLQEGNERIRELKTIMVYLLDPNAIPMHTVVAKPSANTVNVTGSTTWRNIAVPFFWTGYTATTKKKDNDDFTFNPSFSGFVRLWRHAIDDAIRQNPGAVAPDEIVCPITLYDWLTALEWRFLGKDDMPDTIGTYTAISMMPPKGMESMYPGIVPIKEDDPLVSFIEAMRLALLMQRQNLMVPNQSRTGFEPVIDSQDTEPGTTFSDKIISCPELSDFFLDFHVVNSGDHRTLLHRTKQAPHFVNPFGFVCCATVDNIKQTIDLCQRSPLVTEYEATMAALASPKISATTAAAAAAVAAPTATTTESTDTVLTTIGATTTEPKKRKKHKKKQTQEETDKQPKPPKTLHSPPLKRMLLEPEVRVYNLDAPTDQPPVPTTTPAPTDQPTMIGGDDD